MARKLKRLHWDNCKVDWEFVPVRDFCLRWVRDGFGEDQIGAIYDRHLHHMHMMATDIGLNTGRPFHRFRPSSTVKRASRELSGIARKSTRRDRIGRFYRDREASRAQVRAELERALSR